MELVEIPAGVLVMGDNRLSDASPQHRIQVSSFGIGKFPVTNLEFAGFVNGGGYTGERYWTKMGWRALSARPYSTPAYWDDPRFNAPDQPVVGVTWYEAVAFCNWLTERENGWETDKRMRKPEAGTGRAGSEEGERRVRFRLPSEAEWEYAARGMESARNFPWGDKFERERANTAELGIGCTTPVDQFPGGVSPFGVWDLAGNVFEWTLSKWGANWQELQFVYPYRPESGCEDVEGSGARVMRGGSWFNPYPEALCAYRSRYLAGSRGSNIGFRVVRVTG
jgi:formylglycine-generating enzyme required for sulfatase activity